MFCLPSIEISHTQFSIRKKLKPWTEIWSITTFDIISWKNREISTLIFPLKFRNGTSRFRNQVIIIMYIMMHRNKQIGNVVPPQGLYLILRWSGVVESRGSPVVRSNSNTSSMSMSKNNISVKELFFSSRTGPKIFRGEEKLTSWIL